MCQEHCAHAGPVIANLEQARIWDGYEGDHRAEQHERYDRSVRGYHERLLRAAWVVQDEHVLDVGCGNGQSTRDAARAATAGTVLGVDPSERMIERAREFGAREGLRNVRFLLADAHVPIPARDDRRGDQSLRCDVLRRPRCRISKHRSRDENGRTFRECILAAV